MCHPSPPPLYALKDIFGRFGSLIDIFMLNGKNFGYAKYASKNSADEARHVSLFIGFEYLMYIQKSVEPCVFVCVYCISLSGIFFIVDSSWTRDLWNEAKSVSS